MNPQNSTSERRGLTAKTTEFAKGYDLGFSDGFRAACDQCWALGFDEGLKEAAIRE